MKLNHEQMEANEMKQHRLHGKHLSLLIMILTMLVILPTLATASTMIHNSTTLGSTKHGGSWGVAGGKYGEFTCQTCHAKNTGNIKRVKKTITAPNGVDQFPIEADATPPAGGVLFMDAREGTSDFGDDSRADKTQSANICEVCHTYDAAQSVGVKQHAYDMSSAGDSGHYNNADCMVCHPHNQGFKPLDCTACHGYPPSTLDNDGSTTTGLAHNPYTTGSSIVGAHVTHATTLSYACENCHDGYVMPQEGANAGFGDVSIGFNNFGSTTGSYAGQSGVSYNNALSGDDSLTCSTVYCHGSTINGSDPTWTGTVSCGNCHLGTNAQMDNVAALGSHQQHAGSNTGAGQLNLACSKCHASPGAAGHVTGNVSWDLDRTDAKFGNLAVYGGTEIGTSAGRAPTATYASCNGIYCHSPGQNATGGALAIGDTQTVQWGSSVSCGDCHNTATIASGSHTKHLAAASVNGCSDCHTGANDAGTVYSAATHVDQNIDVAAGVTYNAAGTPGNGYGTCSAASCHNDGVSTLVETPVWGTAGDCATCHASDMTTASHGKHLATTLYNVATCGDCHTGAVKDTTAPAGHLDGDLDVSNGYPANVAKGGAPYDSCSTAYCHSPGQNSTGGALAGGDYASVTWGGAVNCGDCHATAAIASGSHAQHLAATGVNGCADCHDTVNNAGDTYNSTNHVDQVINVTAGVTYNAAGAPGNGYGNCTSASCHDDGTGSPGPTPDWGTPGNCATCHLSDMVSGSHEIHLATTAYNTATCGDCHDGAVKDTTAPAEHLDGNVDVYDVTADVGGGISDLGYPSANPKGNGYQSCTTTYCHSSGQSTTDGNSAVPTYNAVTWGSSVSCGECHATASLASGSHAKHLASASVNGCSDCHTGANAAGTVYNSVIHVDSNIDVAAGVTYNAAGAPGNGYGTCSAASCHNDGVSTLVETPVWGVAGDCATCHASDMTTGSHEKHLATTLYNAASCGDCHSGAVKDTTAPVGHLDGDLDVLNGYPANVAKGGAPYDSCSTAYCHSPGQNSTGGALAGGDYASVTWGAAVSCGDCHAVAEGSGLTSGSHAAHLGTAGVNGCADCHTGAANDASSYNNATHVDQNINVAAGVSYNAAGAPGNGYGTCSAASCHDDGTGSVAETPVWGTASACNECHAAAPTTGAHSTHFAAVGTLIASLDCANCHNDAVQGTTEPTGDHRDGNLDVYNSAGGDLGYTANVASTAPAYNTETCNTSYCHGDNMPKGTTSGTTNAPTWGANNADGCTFCHDMAPLAIGAHSGKALTDCITCHGPGAGSINASGTGFTNGGATHINGVVEVNADSCTTCHAADIDGAKTGVHASHTDVATFLSGKTVSGGDYGTNGWYTTTWVNGAPMFGCGECHPAGEGSSHPTNGLNLDLDPSGETPTAGSPKLLNTEGPTNPTFSSGSSVTCSNIYCHSDALAAGSRTYATSPDWYGGTVSGNCNDCHNNGPSSGTHAEHTVGIHYETLYDGTSNLMASSGTAGSGAAHGDSATSDTISCQTCHNDTVAVEYNASNSVCSGCHSDTNTPATGNEVMVINTAGSTHVNAQPDVVFSSLASFKSKAQVRDDITTVTELNNNWARNNGYKAANSFDQGKAAVPGYAAGSCSNIACHNGITTPTWNTGFVANCRACHTTLP